MADVFSSNDRRRIRDVFYAATSDGSELPVIDVTHPAFAPLFDEGAMEKQFSRFTQSERLRAKVPGFLQQAMLALLARRSRLAHALFHASKGVVGGMTLYVAKLGPDMLGPAYANFIDRRIASAPPSWMSRVRLEDMARLLARGVAPALAAKPGRPVHFFNIAGGPGADSWNALLVLQKENAALLAGRTITIHVLDLDHEGPAFGARALAALRGDGGPLRDLDVHFRHVAYDWREPERLRALLADSGAKEAVLAVSSEGGLFEYGSDDEIADNLRSIRDLGPDDSAVVGSVTRAGSHVEFLRHFTVKPRTIEAFRAIAARGGWSIAENIARPLSYDVRLSKTT
ncbi:MAG: hypothetical protein ABW133_19060 [Polyangiaceae bacterium]